MAGAGEELTWSRSRAGALEACPRRYWFGYYGARGGGEPDAPPRTREIFILKYLSTRWMWIGSVVHDAVEAALHDLRAGQRVVAATSAEAALERMRADFRASRAGEHRRHPKSMRGLFEHEYRILVPPERWREAADHARRCIEAFFRTPHHDAFASLPAQDWLPIEKLDSFALDGVRIFVRPDAAFRRPDGRIEIVDWKTGRRTRAGGDPVQLACYALFAIERGWVSSPEEIVTAEVGLATGVVHEKQVTAESIDHIRDVIRTSIREMRDLLDDPGRNLAREERFPTRPSFGGCRQCGFRRVCPDAIPLRH